MSLLFELSVMAGVTWIEVGNSVHFANYKGETEAKPWYIPCFLARSLFISLLFQIVEGDLLMYLLGTVQSFYTCLLLLIRPYETALHNTGILFCEFTILYSIGLAFLHRFIITSEAIQVLLIFILEGTITVCLLLSAIRIGVVYYRILLLKQSTKRPTDQAVSHRNSIIEKNNSSELYPVFRFHLRSIE